MKVTWKGYVAHFISILKFHHFIHVTLAVFFCFFFTKSIVYISASCILIYTESAKVMYTHLLKHKCFNTNIQYPGITRLIEVTFDLSMTSGNVCFLNTCWCYIHECDATFWESIVRQCHRVMVIWSNLVSAQQWRTKPSLCVWDREINSRGCLHAYYPFKHLLEVEVKGGGEGGGEGGGAADVSLPKRICLGDYVSQSRRWTSCRVWWLQVTWRSPVMSPVMSGDHGWATGGGQPRPAGH